MLKGYVVGAKSSDFRRKHWVGEATFFNWKYVYDGVDVSESKRLTALATENAKLKVPLAERHWG